MSNPLSFFRKHQQMMIIVIGTLLVLALVLGVGINAIFDPSGGSDASANNPVEVMVTIDDEKLTTRDLDEIRFQEDFVARVLALAIDRTLQQQGSPVPPAMGIPNIQIVPPNPQQQFSGGARAYPVTDTTALQLHLFRKKGKEIGISISDQDVNDFLMKSTGGAITPLHYIDGTESVGILSEIQGGSGRVNYDEFFEMVRNTLVAQKTAILLMSSNLVVTPESAWASFRDLNRAVSVELLPVNTAAYLAEVKDPTDADLRPLFNKYRSVGGNPNQNQIGFRQQDKIAISYFKADYNIFLEAEKAKVTQEQIQEYYEENKDQFIKESLPAATDEGAAKEETGKEETGEPSSEEAATPDETESTEKTVEAEAPEEEKTSEESTEAPAEEPATSDKAEEKEAPAESDSSSLTPALDTFQVALLQDEDEKAEATKEQPVKEEAAPETATEEAATTEEKPAAVEGAVIEDAPAEPPVVEFKPIEEVEDTIRNAIARPLAQQELEKALKTVRDTLGSTYDFAKKDRYDAEGNINPNFQPYADAELEALAQKNSLEFGKMPLSDFYHASENEQIGQESHTEYVRDPVRGFAPRTRRLIVEVFTSSVPLFKPRLFPGSANDPNVLSLQAADVQFVFWKTGEAQGYLPEFAESKEAVTAVWKQREAAILAKKDAETFAELLTETQGETLAEKLAKILAENTQIAESLIELAKDAEKVIIAENITYFDQISMQQGQPQFGNVPGVEDTSLDFMGAIFSTPVGSVSVAPDAKDSVFYVVRVTSEQSTTEELRDSLLNQAVNDLPPQVRNIGGDRYGLGRQMASELLDEYEVVWELNPRTDGGF